ncbi:acylneuraminate cytidylyltransferase family protein [Flavobacteriaceae sp. LMIT009]
MRVLGLIPARGGSKGIPNKNSKKLLGKPLMQYTIESAKGSHLLDRVIFSSEDEKLIELAKTLGVEVPFVRPSELATDMASSLDVVKHAVKELSRKGEKYDTVCLLQVTNPFRTLTFIDEAISKFVNSRADSLISVLEVSHEYNPHWVFKTNEDQNLELATKDEQIIKRRQDLPKAYYRDGSIYITKTEVILNQNSLFGDSIHYILSDKSRHVNIDTEEDWKRAEMIAKKILG